LAPFSPHRTAWTRDQSARFWDAMSTRVDARAQYFSARLGSSLVDLVRSYGVDLSGRVLDYGCGVGDLLQALIAAGIPCEGADFSPASIAYVRRRFEAERRFRGATLMTLEAQQLEYDAYDVVFLVETIEHLLDDDLTRVLSELRRILRRGGVLVITTPNEDDLAAGEVMCPECGCVFHRMQHMRSWSQTSLVEQMRGAGFDEMRCSPLHLRSSLAATRFFSAATSLLGRKAPHLVYLGRRQ
jgi:2-polyprenyl-3-methyl-5-hydroxy-6-metoxy-1,4-benzoquinol methylase